MWTKAMRIEIDQGLEGGTHSNHNLRPRATKFKTNTTEETST